MKKMFFSLSFLTILSAFTTANWKKVNGKDGIIVYNTTVAGSKHKKSKAETTITYGSLDKAEKVLKDFENYKNWQPNCATSKVLKKLSEHKYIAYMTFDAPWPVSDRDLYIEFTFIKTKSSLKVVSKALPNYQAVKDDFVRIPMSSGIWNITKKEKGALFIQNIGHSSPGGNIPSWLNNSVVEEMPLETMGNFIKQLK